ncbi:hypothetical protein QOT17_002012 [Balamuthia mandrillaris]
MSQFVELAQQLFEALEDGKGFEPVAEHIVAGAPFVCDGIADVKTLEAYYAWMQGFKSKTCPDFSYVIESRCSNDTDVTFVCSCEFTHTGEGGPKPPSNPPKRGSCWYSYTFRFNEEGKVVKMMKVFDWGQAFKTVGWM